MEKIIVAVLFVLAAGAGIAVFVVRKMNSSKSSNLGKRNIIVNRGINVATGQIGSNQDKYFRGMSGEIDTICINQMQKQGYVPPNSYTQIIFCNMESGHTITKNLTGCLDLGRGTWEETSFLHISENPMVSNRHCRILRENGAVYLEDLNSRNHTYLNNRKVAQRMQIKSGDIIALGPERFSITFY